MGILFEVVKAKTTEEWAISRGLFYLDFLKEECDSAKKEIVKRCRHTQNAKKKVDNVHLRFILSVSTKEKNAIDFSDYVERLVSDMHEKLDMHDVSLDSYKIFHQAFSLIHNFRKHNIRLIHSAIAAAAFSKSDRIHQFNYLQFETYQTFCLCPTEGPKSSHITHFSITRTQMPLRAAWFLAVTKASTVLR